MFMFFFSFKLYIRYFRVVFGFGFDFFNGFCGGQVGSRGRPEREKEWRKIYENNILKVSFGGG